MKTAEIDPVDDAVFDAAREHSNGDGCGYCCPHCMKDSDPPASKDFSGERTAVICDHCGETFVIWNETEIRQCSGKLSA